MITSKNKVHLKFNCVDGSIVNRIKEQTLFFQSYCSSRIWNYNRTKHRFLSKDILTRVDKIQCNLEDSNQNPVEFNNEPLKFKSSTFNLFEKLGIHDFIPK